MPAEDSGFDKSGDVIFNVNYASVPIRVQLKVQ